MLRFPPMFRLPDLLPLVPDRRRLPARAGSASTVMAAGLFAWVVLILPTPAEAVVLWNDPDPTLVHETGVGTDVLGGAVKRDDSANDTLYFKFHVDPLSDKDTEPYFAAFELYEGDAERLGIGNSMKAWAYSAFFHGDETIESNNLAGYIDLSTSKPEAASGGAAGSYQYPRRGVGVTIVFKIQYVPGEDDLVTVWLNPDLGPGANEAYQPASLETRFNANASFDEIRLRHGGGGGGWSFSDLAIATAFSDFVDASSARPNDPNSSSLGGATAFTFQSWQKEQGLPQGPVRALAQTHEGYLWLGFDDGLARFDGLRFATFGTQDGPKIGPVSVLFEDHHHVLWVGSPDHGLCRWQNSQAEGRITIHDGLPANSINALAEDSGGRLWIGTGAGLLLWRNGQPSPLEAADQFKGRSIAALCSDRRGGVWMAVKDRGVFHCINDQFVPLTGGSMDDLLKDPHCLLLDRNDRLWIGAGEDYVLCHDGSRWHHYRISRNQAKSHVSALVEEADGTVWAGSAGGGLLQFKDEKFASIPNGTGLAGNLIESLLADQEGRLWVGTDVGLNRLRRKSLFALGQNQGLGFGAAQGLAEVSPGIVWVGKPSDGLYRWDGKSFSRLFATGLSPHDSQVTALLVTRDGFCWVATTNGLLLYKDPLAAADEVSVIPSAPTNVISLAEDHDGALWLGTREGKIWRLFQAGWLTVTNLQVTNAITAIVPDPDGSIWFGSAGDGIFRLQNGAVHHFGKGPERFSGMIHTLYLDAQDTLWIGTADGGLSRLRDGRATSFTAREGLPDNDISQILEDDLGRLWLGTSRGLACVSKQRLNELATGEIQAVYPKLFGRADGMLSEECGSGVWPAGLKTSSGLLWFPTLKGVVVVDPRVQPAKVPLPNVVLEEILVDGIPDPLLHAATRPAGSENSSKEKPGNASGTLQITPGRHRVEFRYTGLSFDAPELMRFRYQLVGLDSDWVDAGSRRAAFYSYLPPGNYQFHVSACNNDGVWTPNEAGLQLVVLRHFWQTWWFVALAGLGLMASVGGAVRIVVKGKLQRRLKHLEQERALERERTRIAQDLHDEMGAKLCRISYLSEHARRGELPPQELRDQITSISDASREVLHSLDEIVWAVNPQNDTLEHVASYIGQYAQEYFQMTGVQCELDIPAQLPPHPLSSQMRHHIFLATHEALTNILKHSGATGARIAMTFDDATFRIEIADDGIGFTVPVAEPAPASSGALAALSGDGLSNMRQRLTDIGGRCRIESRPGHGTRVELVIPIRLPDRNAE